jgi:hypothetical protein
MNFSFTKSTLLIILVFLLAGCSTIRTVTAPPASSQTGTSLPPTAQSSSAKPTMEPATHEQAAITLTPPILPLENTPQPGEVEMLQVLYAQTQPESIETRLSPDEKWRAEVINFACTEVSEGTQIALDLLRLVRTGSGSEQTVDLQIQYCGGLGAFGLGGLSWSENSRYLFYTTAREGVPDGGCSPWYPPLIRYDTLMNLKQALGSSLRSPDGKLVASFSEGYLQVFDPNEEAGWGFPLAEGDQWYRVIAWAEDSRSLVYLINETPVCLPTPTDRSYVVLVDLDQRSGRRLIDSGPPSFGNVRWDTLEYLLLNDENGQEWRYTFATRELVKVP